MATPKSYAPVLPGLFTPAPSPFDAPKAEARKERGHAKANAHADADDTLSATRAQVHRHLATLVARGARFTSDDVYALAAQVGQPLPDGLNLGAWMHHASEQLGMVKADTRPRPSARKAANRRALTVWERRA